jgi:2-iminobutanoate/2-iminopropanoate deaminase
MRQDIEHYSFSDTSIPPAYGPYSHAVVAGDFVFLAGQIARDPVSGHLIEGDITAQTTRCLEIVSDILKSLGLSLADVVRTTVFLSDIADFDAMNRVYAAVFQAPYPVRSTPQVKMPFGALVGIEVTAYRGRTRELESPQRPDDPTDRSPLDP